jgi:hypothetical protein
MKRLWPPFALLVCASFASAPAVLADALRPEEIARLERGETVTHPQNLDENGRRYVGGVTYTIIEISADELLTLLDNDQAYLEVLPRTKRVQKIASDASNLWVLLHQGTSLIDASYTLHVRKEPLEARVRFWVDLTRPHDIEDAWGFFRWNRIRPGAVLLTFGTLVDLGVGLLRSLYEERLRAAMLEVPQRLRRYVQKTRGATAWPSGS